MSNSLTVGSMRVSVGWDYEQAQNYGNTVQAGSFSWSGSLTDGTGTGNSRKIYLVQDTTGIATSTTISIDLSAASDPFGTSLSFSSVKIIYLENTTTSGSGGADIRIGPGASNGYSGTSTPWVSTAIDRVTAGGVYFRARTDAGWTGLDGTHKTIDLTNESGSNLATYKLVIIGT